MMTMLLRFLSGMIVWVVIMGVSLTAIGGTIALWLFYLPRRRSWNSTDALQIGMTQRVILSLSLPCWPRS